MPQNKTVYPFGTNGTLPGSIGIVNDLLTGGADKALSAAAGKELNDRFKSYSSVALPTELSAIITGENKWSLNNGATRCVLIPVQPGDVYRITANSTYQCSYAVLKNDTPVNNAAPNYATGYTAPVSIPTETSAEVVIPSDGVYLYTTTHTINYDVTPVVEKAEFKSVLETIEDTIVNNLVTNAADKSLSAAMGKTLNEKVDGYGEVSLPSELQFMISTANTWQAAGTGSENIRCVLIPVQAGENYRITANSTYQCNCAVLKNDTPVNQETPNYATGWSNKKTIAVDETEYVTIPSDGVYLYVQTHSVSYDTTPAVGKMVAGGVEDKIISKIVNNLTEGGTDKMLSAEQGKVLSERMNLWPVELPNELAYIISANDKWQAAGSSAPAIRCVLVPVQSGDTYKITSNSTYGSSYAVLKNDTPVDGETPNFATGWSGRSTMNTNATAYVTIPSDGVYLYITTHTMSYDSTPVVEKSSNDSVPNNVLAMIDKRAAASNHFPTFIKAGEPTNIIYTIDDFLMAHEYDQANNIDNIKFSNDLGQTWVTKANIWGTIINVFMFLDGTLFFAAKNNNVCQCYWTRDFENFNVCTVLDYDGTAYTAPSGETRFGIIAAVCKHTYVDGVEHYLFGDYIITTDHPRIWFALSDENGVTVRCAFAFDIQQIDGSTVYARHFHGFLFNPYNQYFYVLTGDSTTECHILKGRHDANYAWTWEIVASGPEFKIGSIVFDEGNMFFSTDYTEANLRDKKGLLCVPINDIRVERFRYFFKPTAEFMLEGSANPNNPAAISGFINDNHGWKIMGTDYAGNTKMLIAKGNHNYVWVDNDSGKKLKGYIGPNNNGDVYVWSYDVGYSVSGEDWIKFSHRETFNLTQAMRRSGATDFFEGWIGNAR